MLNLLKDYYRAETDLPCYYQTPLIFTQKTLVHESKATFPQMTLPQVESTQIDG